MADGRLVVTFATDSSADGDTDSSGISARIIDLVSIVDEDGLPGGVPGGDGDVAGEALVTTGDLAIDWGADDANPTAGAGDRSVAFSTGQPGLTGLKSGGLDVNVTILDDGTLIGYTVGSVPISIDEDNVVFFATLSDADSGRYEFTLTGNLDHPVKGTEDDLPLTLAFTATDSDGDTASSSFTVYVDDDEFPGDPVVLDLDGDGVDLSATTSFDIDANGDPDNIRWVGPEDGLLAVDLDGSGLIEDGSELFSEVYDGSSYADSLEALSSLDSNGDGVINADDAAFGDIKVWQDANSDGVTQDGELKSLSDHGIDAIDLDAAAFNQSVDGNTVFAEGSFTRDDGSTGSYIGVTFGAADDDGQNILTGTDADDRLVAALEATIMTGEGGADTFVLTSLAEADIITDYNVDEGDRVDLGALLDGAFGAGQDVADLVQATEDSDGNIILKVDQDGSGTDHGWQDAAILQQHGSMGETIKLVMDEVGTEVNVAVA
ncbi:type I secretion C-terminal target domain-containing protein [Roseibium sp.]|uniref:type I secretion C-terminal target domain-containing protein n=1 Tax=Roseibium sp. TaxID=1936156 RepID=UPI0032992D59